MKLLLRRQALLDIADRGRGLFAATTRKGTVLASSIAELTIAISSDLIEVRIGETAIVVREYDQGGNLFRRIWLFAETSSSRHR